MLAQWVSIVYTLISLWELSGKKWTIHCFFDYFHNILGGFPRVILKMIPVILDESLNWHKWLELQGVGGSVLRKENRHVFTLF